MTLTKIDHKFANSRLNYDAKPNIQNCIKLSFYFKKLPEVSYEQFYGHWSTVHADLTVATEGFAVVKIQRYTQIRQTPEFRAKAAQMVGGRTQMLDFDGCSELWVRSWEDWMKFYESKEYAKAMAPDCKHFMDMPISIYIGEENLVFGKALDGKDGILPKDVKGYE